ncbi:MAG: GreA/GreB family elongation factor, partial [Candidatus Dormibacteraceae bacterium]
LETRIQELEAIVRNHVLIKAKPVSDVVEVLWRVTFVEDGSPAETYQIVPAAEADATHGKLSCESAIARALLGHRVEEEVEVETPSGESYQLRILKVE